MIGFFYKQKKEAFISRDRKKIFYLRYYATTDAHFFLFCFLTEYKFRSERKTVLYFDVQCSSSHVVARTKALLGQTRNYQSKAVLIRRSLPNTACQFSSSIGWSFALWSHISARWKIRLNLINCGWCCFLVMGLFN